MKIAAQLAAIAEFSSLISPSSGRCNSSCAVAPFPSAQLQIQLNAESFCVSPKKLCDRHNTISQNRKYKNTQYKHIIINICILRLKTLIIIFTVLAICNVTRAACAARAHALFSLSLSLVFLLSAF